MNSSVLPNVPPLPSEYRGPDRRKDDTPRWKKRLEIGAFIGGLVLLAVNIGLFIVNIYQMQVTRDSVVIALNEMEISERPWVSLENFSMDSPLTFDSTGAHVTISYDIKNTGHSPAIRGFWQQELFLQFEEVPSPVRKRADACKDAASRSTKIADPRISETWFPGDSIRREVEEAISTGDIAKAVQVQKLAPKSQEIVADSNYLYPELVVCLAYRAAFTNTQYHTGYILMLGRINPKTPYIPPLKSGEIPASELKLMISPFYGIYAD